jgi:hypothetical protein
MALKLVSIKSPCLDYVGDRIGGRITPRSIKNFFYNSNSDTLMAIVPLTLTVWPGWAYKLMAWKAETGEFYSYYLCTVSVWIQSWTNHICPVFSQLLLTETIDPHVINSLVYNNSHGTWEWGGIAYDVSAWDSPPPLNFAVVDGGRLVNIESWNLDIYDYEARTLLASLRLPYTLGNLAHESSQYCWIITSTGAVGKVDYRNLRWEMLSTVQDPSPDALQYLCAFDSKRHRLAVFRERPDGQDGKCRCQIEFYQPIYNAIGLTDPVPVSRVEAGKPVQFVSHLIGDSGEGVPSILVDAALAAPALGKMLSSFAATGVNGACDLRYQADEIGTDTMQVSATMEEDDQ